MSEPALVDLLTGFFDRFAGARAAAMSTPFTGTSADGLVSVTATAEPTVVSVRIDPAATGDQLARDLVEATNDALRQATAAAAVKLAAAADGGQAP